LGGFLLFGVASGATFLPLALYYVQHFREFFTRYDQVGFTSAASPVWELMRSLFRTLQSPFFFGDGTWRHNVSDSPLLHPLVAFACFLGLLLALASVADRLRLVSAPAAAEAMRPFGAATLLVFCGVMSIPPILTTEGIPHALRSGGMLPPLILAAAVIAEMAVELALRAAGSRHARLILAGVVAFAGLMLTQAAWYHYFVLWAEHPKARFAFYPDMTELALQIDRMPNDVPKYVVTNRAGVPGDLHWLVQPVVFITNTASAAQQQQRNLHYVTVAELQASHEVVGHAIYFVVDEAASARAWLQQQAPEADIRMLPHNWQQMQDLTH